MPVRLNDSTSGYVELAAPAVADNSTVNVGELTASGLVPVAPSSVEIATGSGSLSGYTTTFTGATSVSLNGVFTAGYDNYLLILPMVSLTSSSAETQMRFRASGTDATSSNYFFQQLFSATATTGSSSSTTTYLTIQGSGGLTSFAQVLIMKPFSASPTGYRSDGYVGTPQGLQRWGVHNLSTSYDGLTLTFSAGTASGTVSVYGYHL
jgi:hypothetical protein